MSILISIARGILDPIFSLLFLLYLFALDAIYVMGNAILPKKKAGVVITPGHLGAGGQWPKFIPPGPNDARSPCPALNALANHGVLPRNGRGFTWKELGTVVKHSYNLSGSLVVEVPWLSAKFIYNKDYNGKMSLDDLNAHGGIEHDASYTRADVKYQPDQSKPNLDIIEGLYAMAGFDINNLKESDRFTVNDFARYCAYRRAYSKVTNGQFLMNSTAKFFGDANSAMAYETFDGNAAELKIWLQEERFPPNWEPRFRDQFGITITQLHLRAAQIELGIAKCGNLEAQIADAQSGKKV